MLRGALSCWLMLLSLGALGAEAPAAQDEPAEPAAEEQVDAGTGSDDSSDDALAEEIRAAEEAAANAEPAASNEPFIPSVQISEDLSVSFPVDI